VAADEVIDQKDLLYSDGSTVKRLSAFTYDTSDAKTRRKIKPNFAGVAGNSHRVGDSAGLIKVFTEIEVDADVASATFLLRDLVGFAFTGTTPYNQTLVKVEVPAEAIGYVLYRYASAVTKARVRLKSSLVNDKELDGGLSSGETPIERTITGDVKHSSEYVKFSGATGAAELNYRWLKVAGGAWGNCGRFYTIVESATPGGTCNGVHCSLGFGTVSGNITGLGTAGRFTVHVTKRAIGGTVAAVQAELYGEASGDVAGTMSLIRAIVDGSDATAKEAVETKAFFAEIVCAARSGGIVPDSFTGNASHMNKGLKININGSTYYIPLQNAVS
jgi:hypothetical protein